MTQFLFRKTDFPSFLGDSDFWSRKFRHAESPLDEPKLPNWEISSLKYMNPKIHWVPQQSPLFDEAHFLSQNHTSLYLANRMNFDLVEFCHQIIRGVGLLTQFWTVSGQNLEP